MLRVLEATHSVKNWLAVGAEVSDWRSMLPNNTMFLRTQIANCRPRQSTYLVHCSRKGKRTVSSNEFIS